MWNNLSEAWQCAFEEAWTSFKSGSIPIGAVIADENGNIILKDHNRSKEPDTVNRNISHAEANSLRRLDTSQYNPKKLVLYATMELCPMCMGTAVMSNIKHLRYAARDLYCGCVHLGRRVFTSSKSPPNRLTLKSSAPKLRGNPRPVPWQ